MGSQVMSGWLRKTLLVVLASSCGQEKPTGPWLVQRPPSDAAAALARVSTGNVSRKNGAGKTVAVPQQQAQGAFVLWEHGPGTAQLTIDVAGQSSPLVGTSVGTTAVESTAWRHLRADLPQASAGASLTYMSQDESVLRSLPRIYSQRDRTPRPSVVWIVLDTVRADYLGCYGHDRPTSPHMDKLASRSLVFERAISPASWTLPAMTSMLTGLYGESHGVLHTEHQLDGSYVSFVEVLAAAGYTTGAVVSGTFTDSMWGFDQGFDEYDDLGMVVDDRDGGQATIEAMEQGAHRRVTSPEVTDRALHFLERNQDKRFFLMAHYFDPHQDFVEHKGVSERFGPRPAASKAFGNLDPDRAATARLRGLYEGEIAFTDHHLGRLLERLQEPPFGGNVVIVITSDHGEEFYERQWLGHGNSLFNELVHVPLLVHVPGVEARRVKTPVTTLDLAPTLLELCAIGNEFGQGRSLVELFEQEAQESPRSIYSSLFQSIAPESGDISPQIGFRVDRKNSAAVKDERLSAMGELLFDWEQDPAQERNLGRTQPARARKLLEKYERERPRLVELQGQPGQLEFSEDVLKALHGLGYAGEGKDED
jgi:choline-sulfatase